MSFDLAKAGSSGYSGLQQRRKEARKKSPFGGRGITDRVEDPFAPTSPAAINQTIGRYTGMYGAPQTDAQIQSTAQGMLDPVVAALTSAIGARAKSASESIRGNSESLAKSLGLIDYGAPYKTATSEQAAVDEALRASLAGDGGRLSADLQGRLAGIEDPAVAAAGGNVAATGAAAGNTELARGSASLSNLLAQAAAAKSYGQKLPAFAKLGGLQDIAGVERDASQQIGDKTAELLGQLPGIVGNLRSERSNLRGNKAQLAAQLYSTLTGQNVTKATAKAGLAGDQAQLDYNYANANADAAASQATLDERKRHDKAIENAKGAPKPLTTKDRQAAISKLDEYYYGVQPKQHYDTSRHSFVDVPGTGIPGVDYQTAISNLVNAFGITVEQATALANTRYKAGEDGRPMTAQQKTAAVSKAARGREADARAAGAASTVPSTRPAPPNPTSWDPKVDPIVAPSSNPNFARTRSGRYVNKTYGAYVNAQEQAQLANLEGR